MELARLATAPALDGLNILLVDDDEYVRVALGDGLEFLGAQVTSVGSAAAARKVLAGGATFDLLVSDISMPFEDGCTFIASLRETGATIPAAALTANANTSVHERALASGFGAVLRKPFDLHELGATLRNLLQTT